MFRWSQIFALALGVLSVVPPVLGTPAAGPPDWNDQASVYLQNERHAPAPPASATATSTAVANTVEKIATPDPSRISDAAITPAAHNTPNTSEPATAAHKAESRYLPPPSARISTAHQQGEGNHLSARQISHFGLPIQSVYTVGCALAIVVGSFLLFAWALRRGGRMSGRRGGQLPAEVVSVLGRVPLTGRQFAELLRVGNKLVLVSFATTGVETITEVTDPAEVDRLVGLCQQNTPFSTTKAFEHVFQQMSNEPTPSGFLGNDGLPPLGSTAGAYRANRGGTRA